ncbi:MAG: GrpB family protein [bacterium]
MTGSKPKLDTVVGLERGTVRLVSYSSAWHTLFEREKKTLLVALRGIVLKIEHIGSTSVPDMEAKPIIDMAAAVPSLAEVPSCIQPLASVGYEYKGEYNLPGRHFFTKGSPHTYYLHVVAIDSDHWSSWLIFRDYLTAHKDVAAEYSQLKRDLARAYQSDRDAYTKAKSEFISRIVLQARAAPTEGYL